MKAFVTFLFLVSAASVGLALPTSSSANTTGIPPALVQALDAASGGSGGSGGGISAKCMTAMFSVLTDKDFSACLPLPVLMEFLPIALDPSSLLKDPTVLEKPLTDFCAIPKCDDKVIAKAIQTVQDGCSDDTKNIIVEAVLVGLSLYSPGRDIACFKDKDFCLIEEIATVIKLPPSPIKITGDKIADAALVSDPPVLCNKCSKDIVNTFFNFLKANPKVLPLLAAIGLDEKTLGEGQAGIMIKCGASFLDGKIP